MAGDFGAANGPHETEAPTPGTDAFNVVRHTHFQFFMEKENLNLKKFTDEFGSVVRCQTVWRHCRMQTGISVLRMIFFFFFFLADFSCSLGDDIWTKLST